MARDYSQFDKYVNRLSQDVYAQPPDAAHTAWALDTVRTICTIPQGIVNVLDVGCGQGFLADEFKKLGLAWTGVTIGEDYMACKDKGLNVLNEDMTFLPLDDKSFDLVFARHVLEHSPFPIITLMEWRRVCRGWLVLVAPSADYWGERGRNHYSVVPIKLLKWWLERAGWQPIHEHLFTNRDAKFLEHWPVYQQAIANERNHTELVEKLFDDHPPLAVEYRVLCERAEPVTE